MISKISGIEIIENEHVLVKYHEGSGDTLFVTFTSLNNNIGSDENNTGFAENYLRRRNISAIHLIAKWNHWWQPAEIQAAIERVSKLIKSKIYRRVVTYGSSMGAYGAALHAKSVGAHIAILIAPQFSVDPTKPPFESRWAALARKIEFQNDRMAESLSPATKYFIVCDPLFSPDMKHVRLFAEYIPIHLVPVAFGDHWPAGVLEQSGLLGRFVVEAAADKLNVQKFVTELRRHRKKSSTFWNGLGAAAAKRRPKLALHAYIQVAQMKKDNFTALGFISRYYLNSGDMEKAIAWAERATNIKPGKSKSELDAAAHSRGHLAGLYLFAKRYQEAETEILAAIELNPNAALHQRRLSHVLMLQGRIADAVEWAEKAMALDEDDTTSIIHLSGIYRDAKGIAAAREVLERGLKKKPGNTELLATLKKFPEQPKMQESAVSLRLAEFFDLLVGKGKGADFVARIEKTALGEETAGLADELASSDTFAQIYKRSRVNDVRIEGFKKADFAAIGLADPPSEMTFAEAFAEYYEPRLGRRAKGFAALFEKLGSMVSDRPPLIVETGTLRLAGNWAGDGQSTFLFDRFAAAHAGRVLSIDINGESVETARRVCSGYTSLICNDSVMGLQTLSSMLNRRVSLLYLDSFDLDRSDAVPSAIHHAMELAAVMPLLGSGTLVAVDDFNVEGVTGGKGTIVDKYMESVDAKVIFSAYQKIWQIR